MYTIRETPLYIKMVDSLLTKDKQGELHSLISQNPTIGDVGQMGAVVARCDMHGKGKAKGAVIG